RARRRLDRGDLRAHGSRAEARVHRWPTRVGGRQPADSSRLRVDPLARVVADVVDSRGDRADARVVRRQPIRLGARGRLEGRNRMSVIFSRAPLRISLGGGGTDLPSYYGEHGRFLVAGAIDKYIYMLMHTVF